AAAATENALAVLRANGTILTHIDSGIVGQPPTGSHVAAKLNGDAGGRLTSLLSTPQFFAAFFVPPGATAGSLVMWGAASVDGLDEDLVTQMTTGDVVARWGSVPPPPQPALSLVPVQGWHFARAFSQYGEGEPGTGLVQHASCTRYATATAPVRWHLHWTDGQGHKPDVVLDGVPTKRIGSLTGQYALLLLRRINLRDLERIRVFVTTRVLGDGGDASSNFRERLCAKATGFALEESPDMDDDEEVFVYVALGDARPAADTETGSGASARLDPTVLFGPAVASRPDGFYVSPMVVSTSDSALATTRPAGDTVASLITQDDGDYFAFDDQDHAIQSIVLEVGAAAPPRFALTLLEAGWILEGEVKRIRFVNAGMPRGALDIPLDDGSGSTQSPSEEQEQVYAPMGTVRGPLIPDVRDLFDAYPDKERFQDDLRLWDVSRMRSAGMLDGTGIAMTPAKHP
ncbi:unnamed protein product, partial [Symbiodinium sp. KB8]